MAEYVARNGSAFETMMREREKNNPKLKFLFEVCSYNPQSVFQAIKGRVLVGAG